MINSVSSLKVDFGGAVHWLNFTWCMYKACITFIMKKLRTLKVLIWMSLKVKNTLECFKDVKVWFEHCINEVIESMYVFSFCCCCTFWRSPDPEQTYCGKLTCQTKFSLLNNLLRNFPLSMWTKEMPAFLTLPIFKRWLMQGEILFLLNFIYGYALD